MRPTTGYWMYCDNQAALQETVFHECTNHIDADCHFAHERFLDKVIETSYVKFEDNWANLFTKPVGGSRVKHICDEVGMSDIYAPA